DKLPRVKTASFQSGNRSECLDGTRVQLLAQIESWATSPDGHKIYWLNGMAGVGKTTIAQSVAQMLQDKGILGASFFCSRAHDERKDVNLIFPTLAYSLAKVHPAFAVGIVEAIEKDSDVGHYSISQQYSRLISSPSISEELEGQTFIIVIDALDECDNQALTLAALKVIYDNIPASLRFFVTSRPEEHANLNKSITRVLPLHDIEASILTKDIHHYLNTMLRKLSSDGVHPAATYLPSDWPSEEHVDILANRAGRLFIYAFTMYQFVAAYGANPPERLLDLVNMSDSNASNHSIDSLYHQILSHIFTPSGEEKMTCTEKQNLLAILGTILLLYDPQTIQFLSDLLDIKHANVTSFTKKLSSVVHISQPSQHVTIFHASFFDYMTSKERSKEFSVDVKMHHQNLTMRCLLYMDIHLKENMCNLEGRPFLSELADQPEISSTLKYVCIYWTKHLVDGGHVDSEELLEALKNFAQKHLLHWIESLSLLHKVDRAFEFVQDILKSMTYKLMTECQHFLSNFVTIIVDSPLEVYHSALLWTPAKTLWQAQYGKSSDVSHTCQMILKTSSTWSSCMHVMKHNGSKHHIFNGRSVAFSSDGSKVVSTDHDGVCIWNVYTGKLEQALEGSFDCAVFSPDSAKVALVDWRTEVYIWNTYTGMTEQVLEGERISMKASMFSPDSTRLVTRVGLNICIWNVDTGIAEHIMAGHSAFPTSVAFSPDGARIVSGSYDHTIRLWNIPTGTLRYVLKGHSDSVTSVAFSVDGAQIVSGSYDKTVRIWNAHTGMIVHIMEEPGPVALVIMSPDGARVTSSTIKGMVKIWNAHTGQAEHCFNHDDKKLCPIAFSPDGARVVTSGRDNGYEAYIVWDMYRDVPVYHFPEDPEPVRSVAFSPDVALGYGEDSNFCTVWNVSTGALEQILQG
ncbi:hypothetical protein PLICRDRAFT_75534, partial [Plicaturopsis crispa FD-325 SS-3]